MFTHPFKQTWDTSDGDYVAKPYDHYEEVASFDLPDLLAKAQKAALLEVDSPSITDLGEQACRPPTHGFVVNFGLTLNVISSLQEPRVLRLKHLQILFILMCLLASSEGLQNERMLLLQLPMQNLDRILFPPHLKCHHH